MKLAVSICTTKWGHELQNRNQIITEFYIKNSRELHKRVANRAGGAYNAEDVVQEAFARAIKYWDSFDPNRHQLGAWFGTILNNALKDFKREELMYGMCIEFNEELDEGVRMDTTDKQMLKKIEQLIHSKRDSTRDLLDMYYLKGYKTRDIVQALDVDNRTVSIAVWRFKEEVKVRFG